MSELKYQPDIYDGNDPYICISFHQSDRERVLRILQKLDLRGFRFWIDDGITPGMETDEIIAEHIEGCSFFIAFLSGKYLGSLDTVDELNYSRDVNKEYLLVYLEDVSLPAGLDMRFMRARSVRAFQMSDDDVYTQLLGIDGASRFYGIADASLRSTAEKVFDKLEQLYPEHKVFALDAVGKQVSKEISELYVKAGYPSAERLMLDYGFEHISSADARMLRSSVLYQPGFEPEIIKPRIDYIMNTLTADYPGRVISDVLSKSHRSVYQSLLGISVWMGYDSVASMLNAYGFTGVTSDAGRIAVDHNLILEQLTGRYENKKRPSGMMELLSDNPDMKGNLKTLSNRSAELFGMTFVQYLKSIGLIVPAEKEEKTSQLAVNRVRILSDLRALYENDRPAYGTFEDAEDTLNRIVLKRNKKDQIYITDCSGASETVRIPYGVDFIAREAFAGQSDLQTLILPPTLREIREGAFSDCDGLETIVFSEGVERIGNEAFAGCTSLRQVVFPASLKAIGNEAFADCEQLEHVTFGNLRTNVQEDAFDGCLYELEALQEEGASPAEYFELKVDRRNQAKIVAYTGDEEVVVIPGMIGGHPVVSIEKGSFKGNESVREVYISDQIAAVNGDVFRDCKNLEKIHVSESVSALTATVFAGCTALSEANIPDSMTDVQRGLFKDAPLTTLYIGKGTRSISPDAFYKGDADFATGMYFKKKSLENLIIDTGNATFRAVGTMLLSGDGKTLIAELGDPVRAEIPEGVEVIGAMAYDRLSALSEVSFPRTLKRIGEKAFAGTNLQSVELSKSLEVIDAQAFSFCRALTELDINEGLRVIERQAFEGCPIADVFIPASVECLGSDSFLAISTWQGQIAQKFRVDTASPYLKADGVALYQRSEDGLTLIKAYQPALRLKPNEEGPEPVAYRIADGTTVISAHAFARCNNLISVEIPEGVRSIGDMAFWDCAKLCEVRIPQSCTEVSPKAFFGTPVKLI